MGTTTHSIDVNAPIRSVYDQWTQFEEFPSFMRDVVEVHQHGPNSLSWKVLMGGKEKQWEARIIEQIPDTSIVWESVDGTSNRGAITFEPLGADSTRLTVVMEYEPEGLLEKAADLLGVPSGRVEESLKSFRELIESKGTATGGWRGTIESTDLEKASVDKNTSPGSAEPSANGFHASNERESSRRTVPAPEIQTGEHEASMVERPNDNYQEVQNRPSISSETEPSSIQSHTTGSVPDPALQTVPATNLEAGEHEAGMIARVSDKEESRKVEPNDNALDDLEPETANADTAEGYRFNTSFEPDQEDIARRAYELYHARGQAAGHEADDWLEAKRQLLEEKSSKTLL
jgi:Polyketide cyclase / dehydrase and lipid transport/Protein of unknown function (DUF2934)